MKLLATIPAGNDLGEGPQWNERDGRLWWLDIHGHRLHRLDPISGEVVSIETPERIGSFAFLPEKGCRILAAFETGPAYFDIETKSVDWITRPEPLGGGRRFNDGRTDRQGRFWVATMVENAELAGADSASLYRLDPDGTLTVQLGGIAIGNSLCVSPDGRTLYFADTPKKIIFAFDLDPETGTLSKQRVFAEAERGYPDGAVVDEEGSLWSARWGAGEVVRHAADGRVIDRLAVPARQTSCVAVGGTDRKTLFVTSAREGMSEAALAADPQAGNLFLFESEVAGLADAPFTSGR
jgi:sugar lactone lactonase YvrE